MSILAAVSYLVYYDTLLRNETDINRKCDSYFIKKCDSFIKYVYYKMRWYMYLFICMYLYLDIDIQAFLIKNPFNKN